MSTAGDSAVQVRSFVDLRTFADAAVAMGTGWHGGAASLALPDGPVALAALTLDGADLMPTQDEDSFVILLSGALAITSAGVRVALERDRSLVIPADLAFAWEAEPGTRVIVMTCKGAPGSDAIATIDESATLEPSGAPLAALLVGSTPACRNHTDYRSASGEFVCGIWDSTPYHRLPMRYRHYELMHLLEGSVTFVDEAGRSGTFRTGDVFLVEQGAECSWLSTEHVKKVYAIYRPAA